MLTNTRMFDMNHRYICGLFFSILVTAVFLLPAGTCLAASEPILSVPAGAETLEVAINLPDGVKTADSAAWQLVEVDHPKVIVPTQLTTAIASDSTAGGTNGRLIARIPPRDGAKNPRRFRLEAAKVPPPQAEFGLKDVSDKSVEISQGEHPVLAYNHGVITCDRVPEKDHRRRRGCYVHPVWGLNGEVLTDDFSKDHYHHHGIFWTWPHIGIEGKEYNLWSGNDIEDRFVRWLRAAGGNDQISTGLGVENGWFVGQRKVMIERVWIEVYKASDDSRSIDIRLTWIPVDRPITLWGAGGKSYGGLTMRFAPPSRKDKSTVITVPSGRTNADLPDTKLTWADFTAKFAGAAAPSGAAVFVHPGHPDYPPTWLTRHYGPLCVGWPGVKPKTLEPGKPVTLRYRVWIHKAAVQADVIAQAYDAYKAAAAVKWE